MVLSVGFIVASTGTIVINTVLDDKPQPAGGAEQSLVASSLQVIELTSIGTRPVLQVVRTKEQSSAVE